MNSTIITITDKQTYNILATNFPYDPCSASETAPKANGSLYTEAAVYQSVITCL